MILRCEVGLDLDLELVNFGVKLCSSMAADCMDRTPRLESVGVEKKAIRRMDCAKQAQRLANRVKAADCVAPRGVRAAAIDEHMARHGAA